MVDSEKQRDFLIDFSSENDCLIDSPLCDPINPQSSEKGSETKTVRFAMDHEEGEKAKEPSDSSEQDKSIKNGKYNLRKSLAWDSAFFTSAGFLEPDELSSMLEGNEKGQIQTLPGIQEDVNKSYDSLTTMDSESLTMESLEAELFEDVRASIQKSNKVPITPSSSGKMELKTTKTKNVSSSKKVELTTQDKMKQKATPKKPNIGIKDSGKTLKQVVIRPQISQTVQPVARSAATSSLHKPPNVLSSIGLTQTKRASLGAKNVKMEKDAKTVTGRGTTVLKTPLGAARNIVPRPKPTSKPSSCSPASSRTELTSSCSSLESCASVSSNRINKSSLNSIKHKYGSRIVNPSSSGKILTNQSKIAPKGKIQAGSSKVPTFLRSSTKISSSISPASSISEWSSESSSSISAANPSSNVLRASLGTGSRKGLAIDCDAHQVQEEGAEVTGSLDESENKVSVEASRLLHPPLMKPSGLRMPSPKLGFFDGVRSSGRTPNGSMLSRPNVPSGLPKIGAKSTTSLQGSSSKANIAKLQPVRNLSAIQSPKVDVKQTSSTVKSRSSLSTQKSPIAATEVLSSSRNLKTSPGISPKLQNKSSPGTSRERYSKAQGIGSAEKVVGQESKDGARIKDTKIVPLDGIPERTADRACKSDVQKEVASDEADENHCLKTDTVFLYDTNKKEETSVEDQIVAVRKEPIANPHLSHYHEELGNCFEDTKIVPLDKLTEITADIDSKSDVQNTIASKGTTENETYSYPCLKTDSVFLYETNKKEEASVEDQIVTVRKEPIADSHLSHYHEELENSFENTKIVPLDKVTEITADIDSKSDVQNTIASKGTTENETYSYPCLKTDSVFLYNTNKKEEASVEDQIVAVRKELIADSHLSHYHENCFEDTKIVPLDGVTETTADIASKSDVQNTIASKETTENESYNYPCLKTDSVFLYDTNKKEEAPVKDQTDTVWKESIADSHLSHCHKESENSLSNPTPTSPSPKTSEVTSDSRIPFSVKDSFYNTDASLDVLSGSAMAPAKTTILPFHESTLAENNITK